MEPLQNPTQDPNAMPQDPNTTPSGPNLTPQQMTKDLKKLMDSIDEKMNLFNGQKKAASNQLQASQDDAIQELFEVLKRNGIDPSNKDSVNAFLQELQKRNPQGYQIFENAINSLLSQKNTLKDEQPPNGFAEPRS